LGEKKQSCVDCHFLMWEILTRQAMVRGGQDIPRKTEKKRVDNAERVNLKAGNIHAVGRFKGNFEIGCFHQVWPNKISKEREHHKEQFDEDLNHIINKIDRTDFCFFHQFTDGISYKAAERVRLRKWQLEQGKIQQDFQKEQAEKQRKFSEEQAAVQRKMVKSERNVLIATLFVLFLTMCTHIITSPLTGKKLITFLIVAGVSLLAYLFFVFPGWILKWKSSKKSGEK